MCHLDLYLPAILGVAGALTGLVHVTAYLHHEQNVLAFHYIHRSRRLQHLRARGSDMCVSAFKLALLVCGFCGVAIFATDGISNSLHFVATGGSVTEPRDDVGVAKLLHHVYHLYADMRTDSDVVTVSGWVGLNDLGKSLCQCEKYYITKNDQGELPPAFSCEVKCFSDAGGRPEEEHIVEHPCAHARSYVPIHTPNPRIHACRLRL